MVQKYYTPRIALFCAAACPEAENRLRRRELPEKNAAKGYGSCI